MSFGFMCFKSLDGTYRQGNFVENTLRAKHALHKTEDQTHQKWKYWTVIWGHGFLPCRPVSKKARGDRSEAFVEVGRIAHSPIRCQHGMDSLWSLEYARKCCVRILMYDHVCTCCLDVYWSMAVWYRVFFYGWMTIYVLYHFPFTKASRDFLKVTAEGFGTKEFLIRCKCPGNTCTFKFVEKEIPYEEVRNRLEEHFTVRGSAQPSNCPWGLPSCDDTGSSYIVTWWYACFLQAEDALAAAKEALRAILESRSPSSVL